MGGQDVVMPDDIPTTADGQGRHVDPDGLFIRDQRYISTRITADGRDGYPVEPCLLYTSDAADD